MPREELLSRDVRHRDGVDVVPLPQKERHRRKHEGGEREAGRESIPRRRAEPDDGENRQHSDDDERHHVVGSYARRFDDEVTLDDRRNGRDREEAEADPAKALFRIARASIEQRRDEVDQREDRRERRHGREGTGEWLRPEEPDRRRPQREGGDGQRPEDRGGRDVAEQCGDQIDTDGEGVAIQRDDRDRIRDRRKPERQHGRPAWWMTRRRDQDEREVERVGDREREIRAALLENVPNAGGGDDPRGRKREGGAEQRAGRHATKEGSGATCQRGVSATLGWPLLSTRKVTTATACVASATMRTMRATETASVAVANRSAISTTTASARIKPTRISPRPTK